MTASRASKQQLTRHTCYESNTSTKPRTKSNLLVLHTSTHSAHLPHDDDNYCSRYYAFVTCTLNLISISPRHILTDLSFQVECIYLFSTLTYAPLQRQDHPLRYNKDQRNHESHHRSFQYLCGQSQATTTWWEGVVSTQWRMENEHELDSPWRCFKQLYECLQNHLLRRGSSGILGLLCQACVSLFKFLLLLNHASQLFKNQRILQQGGAFFSLLDKYDLTTSSNTLLRPFWVRAEHSKYP